MIRVVAEHGDLPWYIHTFSFAGKRDGWQRIAATIAKKKQDSDGRAEAKSESD